MAGLKIINIPIDDIKEYENNPRKNGKAVNAVLASIRKFGFQNPILINKQKEILAGHSRIKAAREYGMDEIPCIIIDSLTEEEEKAFRLADNKTGELAEWDKTLLEAEMKSIDADDWAEFGFKETELKDLKKPDEYTCPKCGKTFIRM